MGYISFWRVEEMKITLLDLSRTMPLIESCRSTIKVHRGVKDADMWNLVAKSTNIVQLISLCVDLFELASYRFYL